MAEAPRIIQVSEESSIKKYQCLVCSSEKQITTNHWSYTYIWCETCDDFMEHKCLYLPPPVYVLPKR